MRPLPSLSQVAKGDAVGRHAAAAAIAALDEARDLTDEPLQLLRVETIVAIAIGPGEGRSDAVLACLGARELSVLVVVEAAQEFLDALESALELRKGRLGGLVGEALAHRVAVGGVERAVAVDVELAERGLFAAPLGARDAAVLVRVEALERGEPAREQRIAVDPCARRRVVASHRREDAPHELRLRELGLRQLAVRVGVDRLELLLRARELVALEEAALVAVRRGEERGELLLGILCERRTRGEHHGGRDGEWIDGHFVRLVPGAIRSAGSVAVP
jgi:hypothetical protein